MSRRCLALLALLAALGLFTPALMADHGGDKGHGNPHKQFKGGDHGRQGDHARYAARDDARWERRGRYEYRAYGPHDGRPLGWSRGKRVGWGYCGLPPGQAKKYGCWSYMYQGRRYYYYRDDDGRFCVRRPTIIVHAGVDIVQ